MPLPAGTVAFLVTDIEGSTRLWEQHPEAMHLALIRHDAILRHAIETDDGHVFKTVEEQFCAACTPRTGAGRRRSGGPARPVVGAVRRCRPAFAIWYLNSRN
jgi:class 3 adenylate cyclase